MKISIISFSIKGYTLSNKIKELLTEATVEVFVKSKYLDNCIKEDLKSFVKHNFHKDAIIFIGSSGIAVRAISSLITSKAKDPAIVVIDETGKFVISLLSGHLGGANDLTNKIAKLINAIPVITTATDNNKLFACDNFARCNNLYISDLSKIKDISSALVNGKSITIYSKDEIKGKAPKGIYLCNNIKNIQNKENGIVINSIERVFTNQLTLLSKKYILGIGCKKNTDSAFFENKVLNFLNKHNIDLKLINKIVSIDLKKDEKAVNDFANRYGIKFITYTTNELNEVTGDFHTSDFVKKITGVDNVCERSVLRAGGKLIKDLCERDSGITLAIGTKKEEISFD